MFYVYIYLNKLKPIDSYNYDDLTFNYEPFYVGKGKDKRFLYHLNKVKNKCKFKSSIKFNIIKEHIENDIEPLILKIENLSEKESLNLEKEIIKKIGRLDLNTGPLTNRNDGGHKPQDNYHHDEISKEKISISGKNRMAEDRYKIISPDGKIYDNIKLLNFCRDNNLDYQKMRKSSNEGKIKIRITSIKQSKKETLNCIGWEVINKKTGEKNIKINYKFIDSNNREFLLYKGDMIKDFCKKFNLDVRTIRYYKNKGKIKIKNKSQSKIESINCEDWEFIDYSSPNES
jgi:hypothetical protein